MTALVGQVVVMPTWVFLLFLIGGMTLICFLLWANDTQRSDNRRLRRRLLLQDPEQVSQHLLDLFRGGESR